MMCVIRVIKCLSFSSKHLVTGEWLPLHLEMPNTFDIDLHNCSQASVMCNKSHIFLILWALLWHDVCVCINESAL